MKNRPVGVFDSGLGGLTVAAEIMRLLPHEDIIYFGDTAHVPYGSKSAEVVTGFSLAIARFLAARDVKMIVVACNTASAFALPALQRKFSMPILGVIEPGARAALNTTRNRRIGVIGTDGTVRSGSYTNAITALDASAKVFSKSCPLFVPLVEEGWLDHPVTRLVAREYLAELKKKNVDTLVLGCTHYPLIKPLIRQAAGGRIRLIDSATATAVDVAATLQRLSLEARRGARGRYRFFVSDAPKKFQTVGQSFLGRAIAPVKKVSLD
jgi:glutamate racemase